MPGCVSLQQEPTPLRYSYSGQAHCVGRIQAGKPVSVQPGDQAVQCPSEQQLSHLWSQILQQRQSDDVR